MDDETVKKTEELEYQEFREELAEGERALRRLEDSRDHLLQAVAGAGPFDQLKLVPIIVVMNVIIWFVGCLQALAKVIHPSNVQ